jgi:hypothetical protein
MNSARVVGTALACVLIVTIGTTPCFAVNAVSYVAVIGALVMLRPLRPGVRGRRAAGGVRAGLRYAASRRQLWLPLVMMALVGLLAFNFPVILPVLLTGAAATAGMNKHGPRFRLLRSPIQLPCVTWLIVVDLLCSQGICGHVGFCFCG